MKTCLFMVIIIKHKQLQYMRNSCEQPNGLTTISKLHVWSHKSSNEPETKFLKIELHL